MTYSGPVPPVSPWFSVMLKVFVGVGLVGLLWYLLPLMDILEASLMIVGVPLLFCFAIGLIGHSTFQGFQYATTGWIASARSKVMDTLDELKAKDALEAAMRNAS
jgi:hypothetical protein